MFCSKSGFVGAAPSSALRRREIVVQLNAGAEALLDEEDAAHPFAGDLLKQPLTIRARSVGEDGPQALHFARQWVGSELEFNRGAAGLVDPGQGALSHWCQVFHYYFFHSAFTSAQFFRSWK